MTLDEAKKLAKAIRLKARKDAAKIKSDRFIDACNGLAIGPPVAEFRFWEGRKFAFDYAWPEHKIAMEVEGGLFGNGKNCRLCKRPQAMGHTSVTGILRDIEKYNHAAVLGWRIVRVTPDKLTALSTIELLNTITLWNG